MEGELYDDTGLRLKKLRKLAGKLAKIYRWREGDAMWFVLTGYAPPVRPLRIGISVRNTVPKSRSRSYELSTARVTITADAWVDAKEVEQAFRDAQRQILGGDAKKREDRTLEVVKFVARRMQEHGKETWEKRLKEWNRTCPKEWRYNTFRGLRQVFERFVNPTYNRTKYKPPELTPYQAYQVGRVHRRTGEADTG